MPTGPLAADRISVLSPVPPADPTGTRTPGGGWRARELVLFEGHAGGGHDPQAVLVREEYGHVLDAEHGRDRMHDGLQQLFERAVFDQELREQVEPACLGFAPLRLHPGRLQVGGHLGYREHDHHVDPERYPVFSRTDGQGVVRRDVREIEDQEPGDDSGHAADVAPDDDPHHHRDDQDQSDGRDAEVGTERQQDRSDADCGHHAQARTGDPPGHQTIVLHGIPVRRRTWRRAEGPVKEFFRPRGFGSDPVKAPRFTMVTWLTSWSSWGSSGSASS